MAENQNQDTAQEEVELTDSQIEIYASAAVEGEEERVEGSFVFDVGATVQDAVEKFGEDLVRSLFIRALSIKGQAAIRRELENGTHPEDLQSVLGNWDPTEVRTARKDPKATILSSFKGLSEEEREAVLQSLRDQLA